MNKYWSNDDDTQVSYNSERPVQESDPEHSYRRPLQEPLPEQPRQETSGALSPGRRLSRYETRDVEPSGAHEPPQYGGDRSSFLSDAPEETKPPEREMQFAPPPKFTALDDPLSGKPAVPEFYSFGQDGYQVGSEAPPPPDSRKRRRGWIILLIILLVLALLGGGAYVFREQILTWVGDTFGEEVVGKISPTVTPTEEPVTVPAYVESTAVKADTSAMDEIDALTVGVPLETYVVTGQNIVQQYKNADGSSDYYLFTADTGLLLGYYEKAQEFILCAENIFYIDQSPYLITAQGYPLVDLADIEHSAATEGVVISPMVNGWAPVSDIGQTMFNFIGTDGNLISDLWFCKIFPFTADTTLGYVDTGNLTDPDTRYALYLLYQNGETQRLSFAADTDQLLVSVCGMAFMQNGDLCTQDESLTRLAVTDDASAYVNCGALVVRDPETMLYALFVNGVQQYGFEFDSIEPMASDLIWAETENGFVKSYTVVGQTYPLPRSYSFVLKHGDTQQIMTVSAVSEYPLVLN